MKNVHQAPLKPMSRILLSAAVVLAVLLGATGLEAQAFGRVKLVVKTAEGEPLGGAVINVTCEEMGNFNRELKTNKKGEATLSVVDATKKYQMVVSYEGYPDVRVEIKPTLRETITEEVVMEKARTVSQPKEGTLTPAQQAFNDGVKASQDDDVATAKAKFLEALELDPSLAIAHLGLAGLYYDEGNYEATLASVEKLLEADPTNTRGLRILYETHNKLGNKAEAKAALRVLSDLDQGGDAAAALYNEGVASYRVGDNEAARDSFTRALEVQPDLQPAIKALAQIYYKEGNFAEAAVMVEKLLGFEPQNRDYLTMRWEAYRALGDAEKEKEAFDALAAVNPTVLIQQFLEEGAKQFEAGDVDSARANFERILAIDPDHPRANYRLGLCLVNAGDVEGAKEHLQKFIDLAPDDPEAGTAKDMLSYLQ